ncbi:hypothetical protein J4Q44_G00248600 [Coregonus suidteri]|uniref:Uncharacterized protein n=1 Tax=Coregonus suidteri TaxID=861788 RepID=A0AAN8L8U0_9TELE
MHLSLEIDQAHRLQAGSSVVVEGLLSLSTGTFPPAVLAQLHTLKLLVQQQDTARMAKALQELQNSSIMSPDDDTAVVSLFQYWITDIPPMQRDWKTGQPTTQPS